MKVKVETLREQMIVPELEIDGKDLNEIIAEINRLPSIPPIIPGETDIYFIVSTRIGKGTCYQKCEHCVFKAIPEFEIDWATAQEIVEDLQMEGYRIGLTAEDTFSDRFLSLAQKHIAGSAYRMKDLGLTAWTSGARIAKEENWRNLLETVYALGFMAIQINGQAVAGTPLPLRGVPSAFVIQKSIERIQEWNRENPTNFLKIGLTFTIGKYNFRKDFLKNMLNFCLKNKIDMIRYNCFADFSEDRPYYQLERGQIRRFYKYIAEITAELDSPLDVTVSSDFGNEGQEFLGNGNKGVCGAGKRLFRIGKVNGEIIVAACVERMAPVVGKLLKNDKWRIEWDEEKLKQLYYLKPFLYGCFGGIGYKRFNEDVAERIIFDRLPSSFPPFFLSGW